MRFTAVRSVDNRAMKRGGFTLVELMIALLIMGILLTAIYRVFISQESMFRAQEQAAEMQENVRATSEFLHQEMSWLGYDVPGLAIVYAAYREIIYMANLPNTGGTESFVRYTFDATNERLMRAVETTRALAENDTNLRVLANDVDDIFFEYFDGFGTRLDGIDTTPATSPADDNALATIRRVRSTLVVKSSRPDWNYTHPDPKYNNDHFRRRSAVVEVRTRNVEDVTVAAGGVGTGTCSSFVMNVTYPGASGQYSSCSDQQEELAFGTQTLTDNPLVTVTVVDPDGDPDNNTPVSISADYDYIFMEADGTETPVITGRSGGAGSVYMGASSTAVPAEGTQVTISTFFTPPEAGCLQLSNTETLTIMSGMPSRFDTLAPYNPDIQSLEYVLLDVGTPVSPQPSTLPICSSASNIGAKLKVRMEDDCNNGIEGETVDYSRNPAVGSFQTGTQDNGDGTYSVVYIPPDTITTGVSSETVDITAQWTTSSDIRTLTLTPGSAYDMVVNSIEGPKDGGGSYLYQFNSPTSNSFNIERVSNQHVQVNFSVVDECGNRVFGQEGNFTITPSYGTATAVSIDPAADGTYTFDWYSPFGCGPAISNQNIVITDSGIATALGTETINFNLLASLQPFLNLSVTKSTSPYGLTAGCTSDEVDVTAVLQEYDEPTNLCVNLPGPYPVTFTVTGSSAMLGNGSFSHSDLAQDTTTTSTDVLGYAYATLNPGSGMKNQILTVTANADVDGEIYPQQASVQVPMLVSTPNTGSGFYNSVYSAKKGVNEAVRHYDPGDSIYVQVGDCDENEYVLQFDSVGSPIVSVTLQSDPTGDIEKFEIRETGVNSATFRPLSGIMTEQAGANPGDSKLQVNYGDRVTMKYIDNDDPSPIEYTWDVFISGPRWLQLYKVNAAATAESLILSGGAQVLKMYNNDRMRPKVYIPRFESDSSVNTETVTALDSSGSGGETEIVTLREDGDTGIFIPDATVYGQDYILLSKSSVFGPPVDELYLPHTPKTITVSYPDTSPIKISSFVVEDEDLPDVRITAPTDGSTVIGTQDISVYAEDINNTINPDITQVDLYIDTYLVKTWSGVNLDKTTNTYSWVTEALSVPYWLDGTHTMYAEARDGAGNWQRSTSVSVTVANGLQVITFTSPPNNSIYSDTTVNVGLQVATLDTINPSYSIWLKIGSSYRTLTDMGSDAYAYSWDTSVEGTGVIPMLAEVRDSQGNVATANLSAEVDHVPPAISHTTAYGSPSLGSWIGRGEHAFLDFEVRDENGFTGSGTNTVLVSMNAPGGSGYLDTDAIWGFSLPPEGAVNVAWLYQNYWAPSSGDWIGSANWSVTAYDSAQPANAGTASFSYNVDTELPTVSVPVASSPIGSFVKGTQVISSTVTDSYVSRVDITFNNVGLSGSGVTYTETLGTPFNGGYAYTYTWVTDGEYTPGSPWPSGQYTVTVTGRDLTNSNTGSASNSYYVDNGDPIITAGNSPAIPALVTSVVTVPYNADANYGFLASVGYSVFDSSSSAVFSSTRNFTLASAVATTTVSFTVDTRTAPTNGPHYIQAWASDHSGNSSSTAGMTLFNICNREATISSTAYINGPNFDLSIKGTVVQLEPAGPNPVDGAALELTVDNKSIPSFGGTWNFASSGGAYAFTTTGSKFKSGDRLDIQVTNTDSGCHPSFSIDKPSYAETVP